MKTNKLSIDWHSKVWWVSLISILLVLVQQVLALFNIQLPAELSGQVMDIVNSLLAVGGLVGIIYDTSKPKEG
ncbi:phage holin family protein [Companilactobacillus allii]|uniref:Holin n=1 Tax=Companilactobacillus allii TaxID=1847728 RepID=A0A1P8Q5J1_9LACO|nr:phage holin [Companilactobacillus allii]APX73103.1 hypothetical protein BTM29_11315 [Companilactobacillus allii]USQ67904.1 phage holin family protein [Companilactobacillus allii]